MSKSTKSRLLEVTIKTSLIEHLRQKKSIKSNTVVISEMPLDEFSRRVDLVFFDNDTQAFEIKSEADGLNRLEGQLETYLRFFDKVTVVSAQKHIEHVVRLAPSHVGVWLVSGDGSFKIVRRGKKAVSTNKSNLLKMLRVSELSRLARSANISARKLSRPELVHALMDLPSVRIRAAMIDAVRIRYGKTSDAFWKQVRNRKVRPDDLQILSPSNAERKAFAERAKDRLDFWQEWTRQAKTLPDDLHMANMTRYSKGELFGPVPDRIKKLVRDK